MRARSTLLLLLVLVVSCKSSSRAPEPASIGALSAAQAQTLADSLTPVLASCDEQALDAHFNWEWLFRVAARQSGNGAKQERALYKMLRERQGLAREFLCVDGEIAYVGLRNRSDGQALVYRVKTDEGLDFVEFDIGKEASGEPRCLDRQAYRSGWRLRDLLATGPRLEGDIATLVRMRSALASAPKDAIDESKKYSDVSPIQSLAVLAAAHIGADAYRAALSDFHERFPDDLSVYLQAYDVLAGLGHYKLADEAVVALQEGIGDEDGLLTTRVALLIEAKDFDLATELAEKALRAHPEQQEAHYRLLEVHVEHRNFAGAVAVMRLLGERFNVRFTEDSMDTSHSAYVELLASDEWSAY